MGHDILEAGSSESSPFDQALDMQSELRRPGAGVIQSLPALTTPGKSGNDTPQSLAASL
jgi:hypothetical protein